MATEEWVSQTRGEIQGLHDWMGVLSNCVLELTDLAKRQEKAHEEHRQEMAEHRKEVAEYRRETAQYQRLWVHLAKKHGWLDNDDWPPPNPSE